MYHTLRMRVIEGTRQLGHNGDLILDPELLLPIELAPERLTAHVWEHVVKDSSSSSGIDQRKDMRMVQPSGDSDLSEEPMYPDHGAQIRVQHLYRNFAMVLKVGGQVNGCHATGTDLRVDLVAFGY